VSLLQEAANVAVPADWSGETTQTGGDLSQGDLKVLSGLEEHFVHLQASQTSDEPRTVPRTEAMTSPDIAVPESNQPPVEPEPEPEPAPAPRVPPLAPVVEPPTDEVDESELETIQEEAQRAAYRAHEAKEAKESSLAKESARFQQALGATAPVVTGPDAAAQRREALKAKLRAQQEGVVADPAALEPAAPASIPPTPSAAEEKGEGLAEEGLSKEDAAKKRREALKEKMKAEAIARVAAKRAAGGP